MAQQASNAASPSSHGCSPFDVFINHRGPDVKKTLASHLYSRLQQHGLRVFLDVRELEEGDLIDSQIQWAIRTASVHVAIFSPNYAESTWCLNELVMMLESRSTILPVFYNVSPSELRWTRGEDGGLYARALRGLERKQTVASQTNKKKPRHDPNTIEKWRTALSNVSKISGFELSACDGDEGRLADQVVQQVLKKVSKTPLNVAQYPTGLEDKVKEFEKTMSSQKQSGKTQVVGIVGLGGVGKSTLAKELFNRHRSKYDRSCFVYDVRESAAKNSLNSLQATLLKDLAQKEEQINGASEGIDKLRRYLSPVHRALVVLDDVDDIKQLEALFLPVKDTIHPDSLVLVTSRNRDVLKRSRIPETSIYRLTGLNQQHSQELFCSHAFGQSSPSEGFDEVVEYFLDACHGLPLSLKVIGSLLYGEWDLSHWEAQLRKISKILPEDIQTTLKISYDSLDKWEKQIFLDIACFFIKEDSDTAIRVWNGSGWEGKMGFKKLKDRCLVDVDSKNRIRMHDHLRDLGRDLAENEQECRLWRPNDNLLHDLSRQSPVRGIHMVHLNDAEQSFKNLAGRHLLTYMSRLQLLWARGNFVQRLFRVGDLLQLIHLRWDDCPLSSLPSWIPLKNLRVLYLRGQELEALWEHESEAPLQLRELNIDADRLKIIPDSIGKLKHLEIFVLHGNDLGTLPDSVGKLKNLQSFDLSRCSALQVLPDSVGEMTSLKSLNLSECIALQTLPGSVGKMTSLQTLDLSSCSALQVLPDSVGEMTSLQTLHLGSCSALQTLPGSVGKMTSLCTLDLSRCSALQVLPDSVGEMTSLQTLDLQWCRSLQTLPGSVGKMTSLQNLNLWGNTCSALQVLPDSVGEMTSLQRLNLGGCSALQVLPDSVGEMTSLETLGLQGCSALQTLPGSVGKMTSLETLYLSECSALQVLPDSVGEMTSLQILGLDGCSALQTLPGSVGKMTSLRILDLRGCSALQVLPDSVGEMTSLQRLYLRWCYALQTLPGSVGKMTSLHTLDLSRCSALQVLPDSVGEMRSLQNLYLKGCSALQTLPGSVGKMTSLQTLDLRRCAELEEVLGVEHLRLLRRLDVSGCPKLQWSAGVVQQLRRRLNYNFIESGLDEDGSIDYSPDEDGSDEDGSDEYSSDEDGSDEYSSDEDGSDEDGSDEEFIE